MVRLILLTVCDTSVIAANTSTDIALFLVWYLSQKTATFLLDEGPDQSVERQTPSVKAYILGISTKAYV